MLNDAAPSSGSTTAFKWSIIKSNTQLNRGRIELGAWARLKLDKVTDGVLMNTKQAEIVGCLAARVIETFFQPLAGQPSDRRSLINQNFK